jgi:hypothetical protein
MREVFFQEDVQQVKLSPELHESLNRGFILRGLPESGSNGITVLAVITALPDRTFSIKCSYLGLREPSEHGRALHNVQALGYLTQHGVDSLRPHLTCHYEKLVELTVG